MSLTNADRQERWRRRHGSGYGTHHHPAQGLLMNGSADPEDDELPSIPDGMSVGDGVGQWAESVLTVPYGLLQGRPYVLPEWQRTWISEAMGDGVRDAVLTTARKNGKTGLIAALCLAHLCGPLLRRNLRMVAVALDGKTAGELREQLRLTIEASGLSDVEVLRTPPPGRVRGRAGSELHLLASDKATGQATGADVVVIDEAGLMPENQRVVWDGVRGSISGRAGGRVLYISVRGTGPMFEELRDRRGMPGVVWREYCADEDAALDDEAAWAAANPGLMDGIKDVGYLRHRAREAIANRSQEAAFRTFELNVPADPDEQMVIGVQDYRRIVLGEPARRGPVVVGVDLGGAASMSAVAAFWPETGWFEVSAALPGIPPLQERSQGDGVGDLYLRMEEEGSLYVHPGTRVTPIGPLLRAVLGELGTAPVIVTGDRYRREELLQVLDELSVHSLVVFRAQGEESAADLIETQKAVAAGELSTRDTMLLRNACRHAVVAEVGGRPRMVRAKRRSRIDALSAVVVGVGVGRRAWSSGVIRSEPAGVSVVL